MVYIALPVIASFCYHLSRVTADDVRTKCIQVHNMSRSDETAAASATFTEISDDACTSAHNVISFATKRNRPRSTERTMFMDQELVL